jgi:predicted Zn-dependent protease
MFSINIYLRFALIAIGLIGGIALWATQGIWFGIWFVLMGIILAVGYVMLGTVQSAAMFLQTKQFDEAEKRLGLTFFPKYLFSFNKAYYFMLKGQIAMQKGDMEASETYLQKAMTMPMTSDNERAALIVQMAGIHISKNRWTQAQNLLRQLKELKVTEPMIKEQIAMMEKAFQNNKAATQMGKAGYGMPMGGGKRPRPKSR